MTWDFNRWAAAEIEWQVGARAALARLAAEAVANKVRIGGDEDEHRRPDLNRDPGCDPVILCPLSYGGDGVQASAPPAPSC